MSSTLEHDPLVMEWRDAKRRFHEAAFKLISQSGMRRRPGDHDAGPAEEAALEHAKAGIAFHEATARMLSVHADLGRGASKPGMLPFGDADSVSPIAAPAHMLALQASIEQLMLQQKALEVLISYIQSEQRRLRENRMSSSA
ncbi:hypothetical protein L227DRAFT_617606 [Lentinus tigrinus ALCF2SS1-6]|uniref:Uncharacterized protein n=1 Tax=Lentinus tigrinus ALCF2SS1-6 TaxID=1328759 RepID=A0A5C2RM86_9APHY|nr:hypothetical protein L227DRAFT_617606 [Lentinus tigrinus ALCF2SS1-6]